jgi:hypothetical protein
MSKAVSSVTRSVTNVVKGAVKSVSGAVKDVAKSKLGKAVMIAAAIYFGGAALSGAFGGAAGGATGFAGAQAGVSGAASSLSTAWSQALAGNFAQAGSSLGTGFSGNVAGGNASTAMSGLDAGGMGSSPANMGSMTSSGAVSPVASSGGLVNGVGAGAGTGAGAGAGAGGMSVGEGIMGAAKIQAGTALVGGVMQGKAAQDQRDAELSQAGAARDRYNANVGTTWWNAPQQATPPSSAFAVDSTTAAAQNAGLINRSAAEPTYKKYYNA